MEHDLTRAVVTMGDRDDIKAILYQVCELTGMGFAAVARVTEDRWIACQVLDKIELGLKPGEELDIKTTICSEIRQSGRGVVIDSVGDSPEWRTHPVPIIYGFKSYVSLPILVDGGDFFGTLCAIDPSARRISALETVSVLDGFTRQLGEMLTNLPAAQR